MEEEIKYEIDNQIVNGVVVNAGNIQDTLIENAWGYADIDNKIEMRTDTIIDIASVTKVLATTSALLICHDNGLIDFDIPFTIYLPEYTATLKEPITVRDLAMHISGFGHLAYDDTDTGYDLRRKILATPPQNLPRNKWEYSCWNFHLLGIIVEKITGQTLTDFCRCRIFEPLKMNDTSLGKPLTTDITRIAQTCNTEGPGQISDPPAFRLYRDGFTAGNAGAFSTATDLAKFCKCLLRGGKYGSDQHLFSEKSFKAISEPGMSYEEVSRSFGWIVADESKPPGFSNRTIYHSGWSGQTVFLDLEQHFYAVVLTTRTMKDYEKAKKGRFKIIGELGKLLKHTF